MDDCLDTGNYHLGVGRIICFHFIRGIDVLTQLSPKSVDNLVINSSYPFFRPLMARDVVF
jgi:hypothetical protein